MNYFEIFVREVSERTCMQVSHILSEVVHICFYLLTALKDHLCSSKASTVTCTFWLRSSEREIQTPDVAALAMHIYSPYFLGRTRVTNSSLFLWGEHWEAIIALIRMTLIWRIRYVLVCVGSHWVNGPRRREVQRSRWATSNNRLSVFGRPVARRKWPR